MMESPKMHWSTKIILGFLLFLVLLLGVLWVTKKQSFTWLEDFLTSSLAEKATPTPLQELQPSPAVQAFPDGTPLVTAIGMTQIFGGPGEDFEVVAILEPGQQARVEGMNEEETWWAIEVPYLASGRGWVSGERVLAENTLAVRVVSNNALAAGETGETIKGRAVANVNVRSGPGLNYQKVGNLELDQEVELIGADPDRFWYLIVVPGIRKEQGWVSADYVEAQNTDSLPVIRFQPANANKDVPTPAPGKSSLSALAVVNIRSGPDMIFEILGKLQVGQQAEAVGVSADGRWYAIKYTPADSGRAWVAADFVEVENGENLPTLP